MRMAHDLPNPWKSSRVGRYFGRNLDSKPSGGHPGDEVPSSHDNSQPIVNDNSQRDITSPYFCLKKGIIKSSRHFLLEERDSKWHHFRNKNGPFTNEQPITLLKGN